MDKHAIAAFLERIGEVLEIRGENPFKIRAYYNAARTIGGLTQEIGDLIKKKQLIELPGIGKNLAAHIEELHKTGKVKEYVKILKSVPEGILEMLDIPGLGPKKVKAVWEKLDLTSIGDLELACQHGNVATLEGFGQKTQEKILEGIAQLKKHAGQFLYAEAERPAEAVFQKIAKHKNVQRTALAGSLRRRKETVKDIDIVAATDAPKKVMDFFVKLPEVEKILQHGETKSAVVLKAGPQADLRCVSDKEFPYALHHFTGSKEHNVAMRSLALKKGMKMNEYGLFKGKNLISCKDEAEIFGRLGLNYIEPELRENMGEIETAAKGKLPKLVEEKDIRGVVHCHSTWSDGTASIEQMALGAKALGFEFFGIADHSAAAKYAGGLTPERIKKQFKEIDDLNKKLKGIYIFKGMEADVLSDGTMDMGEKVLAGFDYVVASVHSKFNMTEKEMTARVIKAVQNKYVRILGHMTGRLLLQREGYPLNVKEVIDACADYGTAIEINSNPMRLDIDWRNIPYARQKGVMMVINPDAHSVEGISHFRYGVGIARKGWLTAKEVLNTRSMAEVQKWLKR
ncbi:MAG: DNA polymerase/3'-5' exonuclease PolX [Deltaproteobacteria bacterium]|nr:DNA polymerase/3'-5' exonuclease PolX [Deltaproteobacteria bacterium]MBI4223711.1 DNA polymerase/3'-5' exonuclease PolX [Deltaproteobacteria bacterium]